MNSTVGEASRICEAEAFHDLEWDITAAGKCHAILNRLIGRLPHIAECRTADRVADLWQKVTAQKCPRAMVELGDIYLFGGGGVAKDFAKAFTLLNAAADLNDSDAMIYLPAVVMAAKRCQAALVAVAEKVKKAAAVGNPGALYSLSLFLRKRINLEGVPFDYEQSHRSVVKAAELKNPQAMVLLGEDLCFTGHFAEGVELCTKTIDAGFIHGYSVLAKIFEFLNDDAKVIESLQKGADAGDMMSMEELADRYYFGDGPPHGSIHVVVALLERSAELGNPEAMYRLGNTHQEVGHGVLAVHWYEECLTEGAIDPAGVMFLIGKLYRKGLNDLSPNLEKAEQWFKESAAAGSCRAMKRLAGMARKARKGQLAVQWYKKALEADISYPRRIMVFLGRLYQNGLEDLTADQREAVKWYKKAVEKGSEDAAAELRKYATIE